VYEVRSVFGFRLRQHRKKIAAAISAKTTTAATVLPAIAPTAVFRDVELNAGVDEVEEVVEAEGDDAEEVVEFELYLRYCIRQIFGTMHIKFIPHVYCT
jgi:hypothetical protein